MSRAIKYTLSDVCRIIDENEIKYIRIYDGWLNELTPSNYPIHVIFIPAKEAETGRDVKLVLADFVNRFPYRLTLFMKSSTNSSDNAALLVQLEPAANSQNNTPGMNGTRANQSAHQNSDSILLVEIERLKSEMREQNFKREIQDKEAQIEHANTMNARISLVIETLADKFLPRLFPQLAAAPAPAINGATDQEFEAAINYIVEEFKPVGIVKLCYLLRTNEMYRNLVHSEINKL